MIKKTFSIILLSLLTVGCSDFNSFTVKDSFDLEPFEECNSDITIDFKEQFSIDYNTRTSNYHCDGMPILFNKASGAFTHSSINNNLYHGTKLSVHYDFETNIISVNISEDHATYISNDFNELKTTLLDSGKTLLRHSRNKIIEKEENKRQKEITKKKLREASNA